MVAENAQKYIFFQDRLIKMLDSSSKIDRRRMKKKIKYIVYSFSGIIKNFSRQNTEH